MILFNKIKDLSTGAIAVDLFWNRFLYHIILIELILLVRVVISVLLTKLWVHEIVLNVMGSRLPDLLRDARDLLLKYSLVEGILKGVVSKLTFCLL